MGLINLYNTIDKTSESIKANGKIKDVLPEFDFSHAIILKEGNRVDADYEIKPEDILYVRLVPGEAFSTIATIISIAISVIATGVSIGLSVYNNNLANQTMVNANLEALKAQEELKKAQEQTLQAASVAAQEQTSTESGVLTQARQLPFLRGASNTSALGKTIQYLMGEMYNTPYTLTSGFYSLEGRHGEKQYWNAIFSAGFAKQLLKSISIGNTKIKTFTDTTPQSGVYNFDEGTYYSDNNLIEIAQTAEFTQDIFKQKAISNFYQELIPDPTRLYWNENWKQNNPEEWQKLDDQILIKQAPDNIQELEVCFNFLSGFRCWDGSGQYIYSKAELLCYWSNDNGVTWNQMDLERHDVRFDSSDPNGEDHYYYIYADGTELYVDRPYGAITGYWNTKVTPREWISYDDTGIGGKNVIYDYVDESCRYSFKKTFTKAESFGKSILVKVNIHWHQGAGQYSPCYLQYIQAKCYDANKSNSSNNLVKCLPVEAPFNTKTTRIGVKIEANSKTKDLLDQFNIIASGVARTWNGSTWSTDKTATRNPASWLLEILQSDTHSLSKYTDSEIDLDSFGALYEYCVDEGFYTDSLLTDSIKKLDLISEILGTINADLIFNADGKLEIVIDKKETNPVALISSQNVRSIIYAKSLERKVDGIKLTFANRETWAVETINVMLDGGTKGENDIITESELKHVTTYNHAYKVAQRKQRQFKLQPREISVDVGKEGDYYPLYSTVLLQMEQLYQGLRSSTVHSLILNDDEDISGIIIGDSVTFETGKRYGVIIQSQNDDGRKLEYKEVTGTGTTHQLLFTSVIAGDADIIPEFGNIVSFGYLNEDGEFLTFTNVMKITGIAPNDKGITLVLKDYNEAIYEYGTIPAYKSNLTRPTETLPAMKSSDIADHLETVYERLNKVEIGEGTEKPAAPTNVKAVVFRDSIKFSCDLTQSNITNSVTDVYYEINKGNGWISVPGNTYYFIRSTDGYPERNTLQTWKVRAIVKNIYNINSNYSDEQYLDVSNYGTWHIPDLTINNITKEVIDRTVVLRFSTPASAGMENYGNVKYRVSIKRTGIEYGSQYTSDYPVIQEDSNYYKPDLFSSAYDNELNYRTNDVNGYVESSATYSQTLPLAGQNSNKASNTKYKFKVCAINESGYVSNYIEFEITALCTSIRDIVKAHADYKNLYVERLSAIVANVGLINQGGFGDFARSNNYWALSRLLPEDTGLERTVQEGEFRVGDDDAYIQVSYDNSGAAIVSFKTTSFTVTASNTEFSNEVVIQENARALDRTRITTKGTFYEHRKTKDSAWYQIDKMDTSGVVAPTYHANNQINIGNATQLQQRNLGHDIGCSYLSNNAKVWHFDDNEFSQNGNYDGLTIAGNASERGLKGANDSNGIDYTPAILMESPYCINAKSLYGKYSMAYVIASMNACIVDFWMQYRYNEYQELFDIGTAADKISLTIKPDEPVAVVSGVCGWKHSGSIVYTKNRNPEIGAFVYETESKAQEGLESSITITNRTITDFGGVSSITISSDSNVYSFESGMPDMNWETFAPSSMWEDTSVIVNRANYGDTELKHYNQTKSESISFKINWNNKEFIQGQWYHIGIGFSSSKVKFMIDSEQKEFNRYSSQTYDCAISINSTKSTVLIDELYIDTVNETLSDFTGNTTARQPWGSLSQNEDWFIFDAKDTTKVKSNILDAFKSALLASDEFKSAVRALL